MRRFYKTCSEKRLYLKTVIVTGSREYKDLHAMRAVFTELKKEIGKFRLAHGDARGADKLSEYVCKRPPISITDIQPYKADWNLYGISAGPIRNREMINKELELTGAENIIVMAFPLENSIGTYDCMRYAHEKQLEVRVIGIVDPRKL